MASSGRPRGAGRGWREDKEKRKEWKSKLQQAMVRQAQEDVKQRWLAEREGERERKIAKKLLPAQVTWCEDMLSSWDSTAHHVVMRVPTEQDIRGGIITHDYIAQKDGKPREEGLIFSAVRSGSLDLIKFVLEEVEVPLALRESENFNTPLHFAAVSKRADITQITKQLLIHGFLPSTRNRYSWTPADFAYQAENKEVINIFEDKTIEENVKNDLFDTVKGSIHSREEAMKVIMAAVRSKQEDVLNFALLKLPHSINFVDENNGNTPLHYCCLIDDDDSIVRILLEHGADIYARNQLGRTPMNVAEVKDRQKCLKMLIEWEMKLVAGESAAEPDNTREESVQFNNAQVLELFDEQDAVDGSYEDAALQRQESNQSFKPTSSHHNASWNVDQETQSFVMEALNEIRELRSKIQVLEQQQHSRPGALSWAVPPVSQQDQRGREGQGQGIHDERHGEARYADDFDNVKNDGPAAYEEVFYKLHLMHSKLMQQEEVTEKRTQYLTLQQDRLVSDINKKLEEISLQQHRAAEVLAETNSRINSYLIFDKQGKPSQTGKIIVTLRAGHGLLQVDAKKLPNPYVIASIEQQVFMTAEAPQTRNPIWEKECVFEVPAQASKLVVSVLDKNNLRPSKVIILGKAYISLNLVPDEDDENWYDLSTDELGATMRHAGAIRIKRRFVPTQNWTEYMKTRSYEASLLGRRDELVENFGGDGKVNLFGLYIKLIKGEGLYSGSGGNDMSLKISLEMGETRDETDAVAISDSYAWKSDDKEFYWSKVDARNRLRIYLEYDNHGINERVAYVILKADSFPYEEVYEDWHMLEVSTSYQTFKMKPKLRIAFYRTRLVEHHDIIRCLYCGASLPHHFQAPHLTVACPNYLIECPHSRIGCSWKGTRWSCEEHLTSCMFEKLRDSIYANAQEISGIQELILDDVTHVDTALGDKSDLLVSQAQVPRLHKTLQGHKKPLTAISGLPAGRVLATADESGIMKLWNIDNCEELDNMRIHKAEVTCLHANSVFPSLFFSGGSFPDDTLKVWDSSDFSCHQSLLGGGKAFGVNGIAGIRYGEGEEDAARLFSVDDSGQLSEWDVNRGVCVRSVAGHALGAKDMTVSDSLIFTGSLDMTVKCWEVGSFENIFTLDCEGDSCMSVHCSNDWIIGGGSNSIKVWDLRTRRLYRVLDGIKSPLVCVDGNLYCTTFNKPHVIQVWDMSSRDPRQWALIDMLTHHTADVTALAWFQGSLYSGSLDRTVAVWSAKPS